jgi:predicted dinucleotide-binding enzyme
MLTSSATIAIIGFGETGSAFGRTLAQRGFSVRAYDQQLQNGHSAAAMQQCMEMIGVVPRPSLTAALRGAKLVLLALPVESMATVRDAITARLELGQRMLCAHTESDALLRHLGLQSQPVRLHADLQLPALRGELP